MGKKAIDDCSILKAADVKGFVEYMNDPHAMTEEGKSVVARAERVAKLLNFDSL